MPGVPGAGGPVPKRSAERRRRNADSRVDVVASPAAPIDAPPLEGDAAPLAAAWYESLRHSGQAQFFEPSDWAYAQIIAQALTRFLNAGSGNANMLASIQHGMSELLTTEGARRRVRLEIDRQPVAGEKPANVTDYRARLTKGGRRVG